jgi:hypothetical protein
MEHPETDSYFIESYYEEEPMAKLTASLTRKFSVELTDGQWESAEASFAIEIEEPDEGVLQLKESGDAARAFVKAQVDAEMGRQKDEILGIRPLEEVMDAINAAEAFGEEVGAEVTHTPEEKPPLPGDETRAAMAKEFTEVEVVRTPLAEGQATFKVRWLEVATTSQRQKYLRCYGDSPLWKKKWVPAWNDQARQLSGFDGIDDMDDGELAVPFPLEATVMMKDDTYKGKTFRTADKVIGWTRAG